MAGINRKDRGHAGNSKLKEKARGRKEREAEESHCATEFRWTEGGHFESFTYRKIS